MSNTSLSVALVSVSNPQKNYAQNKDLNGGFGTADDYQGSLSALLVRSVKKNAVRLPIIGLAYIQAILKQQGHHVKYLENTLPLPTDKFDLILLHGSIVDYKYENEVCRNIKSLFPSTKVGFYGDFPSTKPELFNGGDFVIVGEAEAFFMNDFKNIDSLQGQVRSTRLTDYDALPVMNLDGFKINEYRYSLMFKEGFISYQGSKGCPYSCSYYCTYGKIQGPKIRQRTAKKIVDDIVHLKKTYGIKIIQFRDPVFGLNKGFIEEFCQELINRKVKIRWGMETRLDLLTEEKIDLMKKVGLRLINVGIETTDPEVAKLNKRLLIQQEHQEKIIKYCDKIGVKICAFYILGLPSDTMESMRATLRYAIKLNTIIARFSVATPYPGTLFFDQLQKEGKILTDNYEKYSQFNVVFKHDHLTPQQVQKRLIYTYLRYYFRIGYFLMVLNYLSQKLFRQIKFRKSK